MLDLFHRKAGTDLENLDVAGQSFIDRIVGRDIRDGDSQEVVDGPAHPVEIDDFRDFADDRPQFFKPFLVVTAGSQQYEYRDPDIEFFRVQQGDSAFDESLFFEFLYVPPARRGGELDVTGDFRERQVSVFLQQGEDLFVNAVHVGPSMRGSGRLSHVSINEKGLPVGKPFFVIQETRITFSSCPWAQRRQP